MDILNELRERYGRSATFALAYGSGYKILLDHIKGSSRRIKKKKLKKVRSWGQSANYMFGIDRGQTFTLKLKHKKGCNKGKTYRKLFHVKDKTVYCIMKHKHEGYNNTIENLVWV